jgi:hypothetical protein
VVVLTKSWVEQPASVRPSPGRRRRCSWAQRCARCARLKLPTWRRARSTRPTRGRGGRKRFRPRRPCSPALRGPLTGWERSPVSRRPAPARRSGAASAGPTPRMVGRGSGGGGGGEQVGRWWRRAGRDAGEEESRGRRSRGGGS